MVTHYRVMQGATFQIDLHHIAAGLFHCFLHGYRHFSSLALAHTNSAITIANHGQRSEAHNTATFHYFGDTINCHHLFPETVGPLFCFDFSHTFVIP